jgi:hypothetical protein
MVNVVMKISRDVTAEAREKREGSPYQVVCLSYVTDVLPADCTMNVLAITITVWLCFLDNERPNYLYCIINHQQMHLRIIKKFNIYS